MTIEEKAKAYDEALERAIEFQKSKDGLCVLTAESIFPELRESEDERIRKWLSECVENLSDGNFIEVSRQDVLCYLEKQKKQKPVEKQDYSGLNDLERAIHRGFLSAGVENVPVIIIKETAQECLAQMKPAEWSEEDERNRDRAIFYTRFYQRNEGTTKGSEECIDWLKSLRPVSKESLQPHWKPSEEQMSILRAVTEHVGRGSRYWGEGLGSLLGSLIKDLEKLM